MERSFLLISSTVARVIRAATASGAPLKTKHHAQKMSYMDKQGSDHKILVKTLVRSLCYALSKTFHLSIEASKLFNPFFYSYAFNDQQYSDKEKLHSSHS